MRPIATLGADARVACMATFPPRYAGLGEVVASLAPQVDALLIYVNGPHEGLPDLRAWPHVELVFAADAAGDLSANGKLHHLDRFNDGYCFTVDDDIVYPQDYVARLSRLLDAMARRCCVTVHGSILPAEARWYYERTRYFAGDEGLAQHQLVTLAGSGTFAFHRSAMPLRFRDVPREVMADLTVSLAARRAGLPILALARPPNWLTFKPGPGLLHGFRRRLTHHTAIARTIDWSFAVYRRLLIVALERAFGKFCPQQARALGLDAELIDGLLTGEPPSAWAHGLMTFERRRRYFAVRRGS